jgi:predicted cobalt transporter CbtA
VIATVIGVWLIAGQKRTWLLRAGGALCLLLPHLLGAPVATEQNLVPDELVRRFSIASVATSGIFWLLAGTLGGLIYSHNQMEAQALHTADRD